MGAEIPPREIRLAVEVMGYVPREFNYSTHENSVFFGELTVDGRVAAATGQDSWRCGLLPYRDFHAEAMSHGRRYPVELYALREGYADWRTGEIPQETGFEVVAEALEETWKDGGRREDSKISEDSTGRIIQERRVAMPDMGKVPAFRACSAWNPVLSTGLPGTGGRRTHIWPAAEARISDGPLWTGRAA